jgi:TPR repeat protein
VPGREHREAKEQPTANSALVTVQVDRPPKVDTVVVTHVELGSQPSPGNRDDDAVRRYRQEADGGNATAQFILGGMYAQGLHGLPRDEAEAVKWYELAARQGSEYAQAALKRLGVSW